MSDLPPPPPPGPSSVPPPPDNLTPPPGYVAYQGAPTPTGGSLGRVTGLRTAITVLTAISAVGALIAAVLTSTVTESADDFLAGNIDEDAFTTDYGRVLIGQALQGFAQIALIVVTMVWLFKVAKNLRIYGRATTWAPIWAVFGWVLPPVLVVIPFLMVREVWKASDPAVPYGSDEWKRSPEPMTVLAWFLVYGVGTAALLAFQVNSALGQGFGTDTEAIAESVADFGVLSWIGTAVTVIAAALWIMVVREVTTRHTQLTGER